MDSDRPTTDVYFLRMLDAVASRATCPRRRVACLFVDADKRLLATGYNGVPRHFAHCTEPTSRCAGYLDAGGNTNRCLAVHAEQNAILQCLDLDRVDTVYCSASPCFVCSKLLLNLKNLKRVVFLDLYPDEAALQLWKRTGKLGWYFPEEARFKFLDKNAEGVVWWE